MKNLIKLFKNLLIILLLVIFIRYVFILLVIWGALEVIIYSIRNKNFRKIKEFICNFVITVLNCINILSNIILQVPANRILLTTTTDTPGKFGDPTKSFTKILKINFLYGNLTPRGMALYKIISFFNKK